MIKKISFKNFDWLLFVSLILLTFLGLIIQYSLNLDNPFSEQSPFRRQIFFSLVGVFLFFFTAFIDYRFFKKITWLLYFFLIVLLVLVLFFGKTYRGIRGWLFGFQVSEFAKLVLILVLARFFSHQGERLLNFKKSLLSGLIVFLPVFLIFKQPDFGSGFILIILWLFLLFLVDKRLINFGKLVLILSLILVSAWFLFLKDYQKERILTFINPRRDPFGSGYQITQSIIAVGSGRFLGKGFGLGPQSQLRFLPETKTDFVFSVLAEEWGFLFASLVLVLYFILFWRFFRILKSTYDDYGILLISGISLMIFIQVFINIGMNIGLAPVAGIPLPFLSYGGSSLLINFFLLGLAESLAIHQIRTVS